MANSLTLSWESGTAYDFLASLYVLHHPDRFGLRPSWAAGVRSRIPAAERRFLEETNNLFALPAPWIHSLPVPRHAMSVLWALEQLPAAERLPAIALTAETPAPVRETLLGVAQRGAWSAHDLDILRSMGHSPARPRSWNEILDWWARSEAFGQGYLAALQAYHAVFFAEEEARILPTLQSALERAQEMAERLPLDDLVDALSGGLHIPRLSTAEVLILAPSYWLTPLVFFGALSPERMLLIFGARPPEATLVPGEGVPDALLAALKALADPTRLKILRLLSQSPLTLTELARQLRLRLPTITHHLNALRLAGLVQVSLEEGGEKRYAVRRQAAGATFDALAVFLNHSSLENSV